MGLGLPSDATPALQVQEESGAGRRPVSYRMALYRYPVALGTAWHSAAMLSTGPQQLPPEFLVPQFENTAFYPAKFLAGPKHADL